MPASSPPLRASITLVSLPKPPLRGLGFLAAAADVRLSNARQHKKDSPLPLLSSVSPRSTVVGEGFGTPKACGTTSALGKKSFKQTRAERLAEVVLNLLLFVNNLATSVGGAAKQRAPRARSNSIGGRARPPRRATTGRRGVGVHCACYE